jgi:esterase/lipase superfamily enzyme
VHREHPSHTQARRARISFRRFEFRPNPEKHIVLQEVTTLEEDAFFDSVKQRVDSSRAKDAFVFVHGYNVDFETAARRAGQFAFDLGFIGAPILYSWPSNGTFEDYASDAANVGWTASHLDRFLRLLEARSGASKIHLIAHSMGNRAVCDALKALSYDRTAQAHPLLHHLVLAAPDIDAETFRQLASALRLVSDHITLYASSKDKALAASAKLHKYPRAGGLPVLVLPDVESIDASAVASDFLAHSYFAGTYPLLSDIYELLSDDKPASKRFALRSTTSTDGVYYMFKP